MNFFQKRECGWYFERLKRKPTAVENQTTSGKRHTDRSSDRPQVTFSEFCSLLHRRYPYPCMFSQNTLLLVPFACQFLVRPGTMTYAVSKVLFDIPAQFFTCHDNRFYNNKLSSKGRFVSKLVGRSQISLYGCMATLARRTPLLRVALLPLPNIDFGCVKP